MRIADLERDLHSMIPTDVAPDSEFMYRRMWEATETALRVDALGPDARVLDLAGGTGADAARLAEHGLKVFAAEPSGQMIALGALASAQAGRSAPAVTLRWVRSFAETLPFADRSFDAAYCKGSLDHFEDPRAAIRELARVTRPRGRVVLAVANMHGWGRSVAARADTRDRRDRPGRRASDIPGDHLTRYEPGLLREHFSEFVELETLQGVSLLWSTRLWRRTLQALPVPVSDGLLATSDRIARVFPSLADVTILAGRPRG